MIEVTVAPRALDGVRQVEGVDRLWVAAPGVCGLVGHKWSVSGDAAGEGECGFDAPCPEHGVAGARPADWMKRAAGTCETCGGTASIIVNQTITWPYGEQAQCPDCLDGKPLVDLRVPYCNCRPGLDGTGWYHERDCVGTVSAGVWKLVAGPARLVPDHALPDDALAYVVRDEDDCGWWYYPPDADDSVYRPDLTHLHDGDPSTLVGQWAVELERVASQTLPRPHLTDPEAGK